MVTVFSAAALSNDNIGKTILFDDLEMLATVAEKVYEEEHQLRPISDKKPLRFDLNLKPRTYGRPRSAPIDIDALLPCLRQKRKLEERVEDVTTHSRNCKKVRLIIHLRQPEILSDYKKKIDELGGSNIRFVIHKKLDKSDMNMKKNRLSVPYKKCMFDLGAITEMQQQVKVIQPASNFRDMIMTFARRDSESSYVFTGSWNDLVEINGFQKGDIIQVWSFKQREELGFAFVKL